VPEEAPPGSAPDHHVDEPAHSRAGEVALDGSPVSNITIPKGQDCTQTSPFVE